MEPMSLQCLVLREWQVYLIVMNNEIAGSVSQGN